eukprot:1150373-Pelagomonas_calceolata.AAC.10
MPRASGSPLHIPSSSLEAGAEWMLSKAIVFEAARMDLFSLMYRCGMKPMLLANATNPITLEALLQKQQSKETCGRQLCQA